MNHFKTESVLILLVFYITPLLKQGLRSNRETEHQRATEAVVSFNKPSYLQSFDCVLHQTKYVKTQRVTAAAL